MILWYNNSYQHSTQLVKVFYNIFSIAILQELTIITQQIIQFMAISDKEATKTFLVSYYIKHKKQKK